MHETYFSSSQEITVEVEVDIEVEVEVVGGVSNLGEREREREAKEAGGPRWALGGARGTKVGG